MLKNIVEVTILQDILLFTVSESIHYCGSAVNSHRADMVHLLNWKYNFVH